MFVLALVLLAAGFVAFHVAGGFGVVVLAVGVVVGARAGGHYYMRRYTEYEHSVRMSRSGLRR